MSSSTPSRSCCRSWITPLIISNGISSNRIKRAIAPSFRVRLRFMGTLPVWMGKVWGRCVGVFMGGNVESVWSLKRSQPTAAPTPSADSCRSCRRLRSLAVCRQTQTYFNTALDITDTHRPAMQLNHFFNEVKPQPRTFYAHCPDAVVSRNARSSAAMHSRESPRPG